MTAAAKIAYPATNTPEFWLIAARAHRDYGRRYSTNALGRAVQEEYSAYCERRAAKLVAK